MDRVKKILAEHAGRRIRAGKSGAEIWAVESDLLLKYARHAEISDEGPAAPAIPDNAA